MGFDRVLILQSDGNQGFFGPLPLIMPFLFASLYFSNRGSPAMAVELARGTGMIYV